MSNPKALGKLVNGDTKAELNINLVPNEIIVDTSHNLKIDACLGRSLPIVSFQGAGAKTLNTSLVFDRDAEENLDLKKVSDFFDGLSKVKAETQSVPLVTFSLGSGFQFKGYLSHLNLTHSRFTQSGQPSQIRASLQMVASEEGTHA